MLTLIVGAIFVFIGANAIVGIVLYGTSVDPDTDARRQLK